MARHFDTSLRLDPSRLSGERRGGTHALDSYLHMYLSQSSLTAVSFSGDKASLHVMAPQRWR